MNVHKNARLTFVRRMELVSDVLQVGLTQAEAVRLRRVSVPRRTAIRGLLRQVVGRSNSCTTCDYETAKEILTRLQDVDTEAFVYAIRRQAHGTLRPAV